jgi:hypothetical protein
VPFELGRPFGTPNDASFQKRVLNAALGLLETPSGPVLVDFPEEAPLSADLTGWACPLNLAEDKRGSTGDLSLLEILKREITFLKPWYDLTAQKQGRTTVGVSGLEIEQAAGLLVAFLTDPSTPSPRPELPVGEALKLASEDLKAYYFEGAAAQPGEATSRQMADWFWGETRAGRLLFDLQKVCLQNSDPLIKMLGTLLLIPRSQAHRAPVG